MTAIKQLVSVFVFQEQLDNWDFDIFRAEALSDKQPLRYVGQELFSRHDLFRRCNVSHSHRVWCVGCWWWWWGEGRFF